MSVVSFALAVVFIIRLFSTSAFRVPKLANLNYRIGVHINFVQSGIPALV